MYCGKCGAKIIDEDNFCRKCGKQISDDNYINNSFEREKDSGMRWYNFYTYFYLPFSMISNVFILLNDFEDINFLLFFSLLWFIFIGITFAFLLFKKIIGYYLNLALLISCPLMIYSLTLIDLADKDIFYGIGYSLGFMIISLPWTILNILYFKKRKYLFK